MKQAGFALPLSLLAVALLALAASSVALTQTIAGRRVEREAEMAQFERLALSAEAHAIFLAITEPKTTRGAAIGADPSIVETLDIAEQGVRGGADDAIQEWRWDGRAYRFESGAQPSLLIATQDLAGLIAFPAAGVEPVRAFLENNGVSSDRARAAADQMLNQSGTSQSAGASAPQNLPALPVSVSALTMNALARRAGWDVVIPENPIADLDNAFTTVSGLDTFNPNTASADVLRAMFGLGVREAQSAHDQLQVRSALDAVDLTTLTGPFGFPPQVYVAAIPARTVRVRILAQDLLVFGNALYEAHISVAQEGDGRPFMKRGQLVANVSPRSVNRIQKSDEVIAALPQSTALSGR
jgi:type II secretory pathway pseudopilin PulG